MTTATKTHKKITRATAKSFVRKNRAMLFIKAKSSFSGMSDMVEYDSKASFKIAKHNESNFNHTQGVVGLWLVGGNGDRFNHFENDDFVGIEVYNCCGSCILAVLK